MDRSALAVMLAAVPHRGPDGCWVRLWPGLGLGYAKLAVTPEEEREQQPLVSPRTGCAVVADARLDNRADLLAQIPEDPSSTASDAELILRAYETWGADAPIRLLGDFAFAIWDPRRRRVLCARDTSGQRPLFYRIDHRAFSAASEVHQLLQDSSVPIAPNEQRILDYLTPFRVHRNQQEQGTTFFAGIHSLPAGHVLVVDSSTHRLTPYWTLSVPREIRYRHDHEYAAHFVNLLGEALRARLRTSHPVGAMLSGGLDSSSVVCLAQHLYRLGLAENRGFVTFSLVFEGLACDETPLIRDVQAMYGFDAQYVRASGRGADFVPQPDGFMSGPAMPIAQLDALIAAASQAGVRTLLSGLLADNCFGWSREFFASLLRRGRFGEFQRHLRRYRAVSGESLRKTVALHCLLPLLPLDLQRPFRSAYVRWDTGRQRGALVPSWIPERVRTDLFQRHLALVLDAERSRRFGADEREQILCNLYPAEVSPLSGAFPVEMVRPFADRRLHEFVLAIPPEQIYEPHPYSDHFYAGHKLILRRGMAGILPESVRTRTYKTLFTSAVVDEIERQWPAYVDSFGPGAKPEVAKRGYIDPPLFWERLKQMRAGDFGQDGMYVIRVLNLETWLRTFSLRRPQIVTVREPRPGWRPNGGQDRPLQSAINHV